MYNFHKIFVLYKNILTNVTIRIIINSINKLNEFIYNMKK